MRRRCIATLVLGLTGLVPASGAAQSETVPQAAARVRSAIPAIEAYRADRGTYVGLTLAKIRSYDTSVRGVAVRRATRNGYCIQSTIAGPVVHYDGPRGPLRRGRCGVLGAIVPSAPPRQPAPAPTDAAAVAQSRLRAAVPAIEAHAADNGGYAGLTLEKILFWDRGVVGIRVVWSTRSQYCIASTVGAATYHLRGPANPPTRGPCPAAP